MKVFTYSVELTKPEKILVLIISSLGFLFLSIFLFDWLQFGNVGIIVSIIIAIIYFILVRKLLIKKVLLVIDKNKIIIDNKSIYLENIVQYKAHKMGGAGIFFKLQNGESIKLSANDNFCSADGLTDFIKQFEKIVINQKGIQKVHSFGETKFGLFFSLSVTFLLILGIVYRLISGPNIQFSQLMLVVVALSILWSGIEIKKHLPTKAKLH